MKKRRTIRNRIGPGGRYDSLILRETTTYDQTDAQELPHAPSSIDGDLIGLVGYANRYVGDDPDAWLHADRHPPLSIKEAACQVLFYVRATRQHLADGNASDALWCALRAQGAQGIIRLLEMELNYRIGAALTRASSRPKFTAEEKAQWLAIYRLNPARSDHAIADSIIRKMGYGGEAKRTIRSFLSATRKQLK
jgi:hypothetical protein